MVGKPGSSHTFSIAERSGIPKPLIDRAKTLVDIEHLRYDHMLSNIEILEKQLDEKSSEVNNLKSKIEELLAAVNEEKKQTSLLKNRIQQSHQSQHKPSPFYREAEKIMQRLLREWEAKKDKFDEQEHIANETRKLFEKMYPLKATKSIVVKGKEVQVPITQDSDIYLEGEIREGSLVKVIHLNQKGNVISLSGKKAKVNVRGMLIEVVLSNLRLVE
jgi:DNA mismatch repair protein MutS2